MKLKVTGSKGVDWIKVAQDRVQWQALVNTVLKLLLPYKVGISLPAERRSISEEGFCSMKLHNLEYTHTFSFLCHLWSFLVSYPILLLQKQ
jgi:hypothetical protein